MSRCAAVRVWRIATHSGLLVAARWTADHGRDRLGRARARDPHRHLTAEQGRAHGVVSGGGRSLSTSRHRARFPRMERTWYERREGRCARRAPGALRASGLHSLQERARSIVARIRGVSECRARALGRGCIRRALVRAVRSRSAVRIRGDGRSLGSLRRPGGSNHAASRRRRASSARRGLLLR